MRLVVLAALLLCSISAQAKFVVYKTELTTDQFTETAAQLKEMHLLKDIADQLNGAIKVEAKVGMRFAECDEENSFYDPETKTISMCLELVQGFYTSLKKKGQSKKQLNDAVAGAFLFYVYHEIGHALIDVLEVPITGREEDAADQLAAWLLIDNGEGDKAALDAAMSFSYDAMQADSVEDTDYADEHSLSRQRYFNIVCWVYGSSPDSYPDLVSEKMLPDDRAEQCSGEYEQIDRSWNKLLAKYIKQ